MYFIASTKVIFPLFEWRSHSFLFNCDLIPNIPLIELKSQQGLIYEIMGHFCYWPAGVHISFGRSSVTESPWGVTTQTHLYLTGTHAPIVHYSLVLK